MRNPPQRGAFREESFQINLLTHLLRLALLQTLYVVGFSGI